MTASTNCFTATFRRSSARATRRAAAIDELYAEDCVLYVPPSTFVGREALDSTASILEERRWQYSCTASSPPSSHKRL